MKAHDISPEAMFIKIFHCWMFLKTHFAILVHCSSNCVAAIGTCQRSILEGRRVRTRRRAQGSGERKGFRSKSIRSPLHLVRFPDWLGSGNLTPKDFQSTIIGMGWFPFRLYLCKAASPHKFSKPCGGIPKGHQHHIWVIYLPYISHISAIYQSYISHISVIYQSYQVMYSRTLWLQELLRS